MKVLVAGDGFRVFSVCEVFSSEKLLLVSTKNDAPFGKTLKKDPITINLKNDGIKLGKDDLIVVVEDDEERLKLALENITPQSTEIPIIAITVKSAKDLRKYFPSVIFKSIRDIYKNEFKNLLARSDTLKKISLINQITTQNKKTVIIIWGSPDPDAMGSAFALKHLIRNSCPDAKIVYMRDFSRPENIAMKNLLKIPMEKYEPEAIKDATIMTVDAQQTFFEQNHGIEIDLVIDHHPIAKPLKYRFSDIRPAYGATCTILTEYLFTVEQTIPKQIATALYYGIKVDTNNLSRNASDSDINSFRRLRKLMDENILRAIELSQMPIDVLDYFGLALASKKMANNVIFSYLGQIRDIEICPYIADFFMRLEGIAWVIIACRSVDNIYVILRSDGLRNDVGVLANSVFSNYGQAGGHRTMARAEFTMDKIRPELADTTDHSIEQWLISKLATKLKPLSNLHTTW